MQVTDAEAYNKGISHEKMSSSATEKAFTFLKVIVGFFTF